MYGSSLATDNYSLGLISAPNFRQYKRTVETYDNLPIFFKCSNGANITFIDKIIKTEK